MRDIRFKTRSPPARLTGFVSLGSKVGCEPHMRHQNKGIFNQNNNLEWLLLAFEATRFGGGKTKNPSRHDPVLSGSFIGSSHKSINNMDGETSHTAMTRSRDNLVIAAPLKGPIDLPLTHMSPSGTHPQGDKPF